MCLTNSLGLQALCVPEELEERRGIGPQKRRKIKFAFFQSDFKGGRIPFWHVDYLNKNDFGTTLSMQGLKEWKII
jgi:hypothetical protein